MSSVTPPGQPSEPLTIAIVGNDALIEALPARPIQFAHACQAAGFDLVLPESWGDELVAEATLRQLSERPGSPAVLCACPFVRERLLASGVELAPLLINTVAPPVALARYVRALYGARLAHLAYIGDCPAAGGPEYDAQHRTLDFLRYLRARGVDLLAQPTVFDAVLPPDRRRFLSLPGGCPTPESLWEHGDQRSLVGLHSGGEEFAIELAEQLLARQPVLVDVAPPLGCVCSGVTPTTPGHSGRIAVMSLEPPRAASPVVDLNVVPTLNEPIRSPRGGGGGTRGVASPANWSREPNVTGRPPIAITPPWVLSVKAATREAPSSAHRPIATGVVVSAAPDVAVRQVSPPATPPLESGLPATPARSIRSISRPASGGVPTVRLPDPVVFRLPRAYMTRRRAQTRPSHEEPTAPTPPGEREERPAPATPDTSAAKPSEVGAPQVVPKVSTRPETPLTGSEVSPSTEGQPRRRFGSRIFEDKTRRTRLLVRLLIALALLAVFALLVRQVI